MLLTYDRLNETKASTLYARLSPERILRKIDFALVLVLALFAFWILRALGCCSENPKGYQS